MTRQAWNAVDYAREGRFVAELAQAVFSLLAPQPGEHILDLGCGDGALTAKLVAAGAEVVGVDSSAAMVAAAQTAGLDARLLGMESLPFQGEFDAVFSNAALHWVRDQSHDALLAGVRRALKPGGRFVAEMGGHGNIAAVRTALRAVLAERGRVDLVESEGEENYFPSPAVYASRLVAQGFAVEGIELAPRPTPLGPGGIRGWYTTFRSGVLAALPPGEREAVLAKVEELLAPVLRDGTGAWIADYVRLRFRATVR